MEKKKKWQTLLTVVLLLAGAALSVKPAWYLYRDISFYWTEHTEAEYRVKAYAEENRISIACYPDSLIGLLERNPEAEEFVLNYPFRSSQPATLEGISREEVPLLLQWDPRWGYVRYGSDVLGLTGCGPTCLSMVHYYLTGDTAMTPDAVARFAEEKGYYEKGYGSAWTLFSQGGAELGLSVQELPLSEKKMVDSLESGFPIVCSVRAGDFTTTGHYIVLTGVEDGRFRVNDPNSRVRSERLWSYDEIEGQIRNLWAFYLGN